MTSPAYAPPSEDPSPARRLAPLFARPSAIAGALLLAHCLILALELGPKYWWGGFVPDSSWALEYLSRAALGVGLILSERRFLATLALALVAVHAGYPLFLLRGRGWFIQLEIVAMFGAGELLPFGLLLLGHPQRVRRRLALLVFVLAEGSMLAFTVDRLLIQAHYKVGERVRAARASAAAAH